MNTMTKRERRAALPTHDELLEAYQGGQAALAVDHINHREFVKDGTRYFCGYSSQSDGKGGVLGWKTYKKRKRLSSKGRHEHNTTQQNNCDGSGPHTPGEVRVLPTGGGANAILCRACLAREIQWRRQRNQELSVDCKFDLPAETARYLRGTHTAWSRIANGEHIFVVYPNGETPTPTSGGYFSLDTALRVKGLC